jgi:hypothetical protein
MSLILSGTSGVSDVDGTAAAPAIRGTDANTGIFFPGADRIGFAEGGVQVGEFDANGNFLMNSGYGSVGIAYACRAWVNFNGSGTVAIRAAGNVSSITDLGTGRFQLNFTAAMPDANFAIAGTTRTSSANFNGYVSWEATASVADTTFVKIATTNTAGSYIDGDYISVIVSR